MRFSFFLALLVATFIACANLARAENVHGLRDGTRRLQAGAPIKSAKNVATYFEKWRGDAIISKAVNRIKAANGDEKAIRGAINLAIVSKRGIKIGDDAVAKYAQTLATAAKKNPKSWPRLRKFVKITLGATVGGLAIYGAYKLMTKDSAAAATTTTTGSA
ncbi:RxLR effector protein [Phytophthora megakarya]|uniref:RxLR effector protein n=1 Tax=Phytophthora megakarya TaxID=4795 RepID=A0A225VXY4_9STRA|nr:RxLR effector protein [Phytophthora megakarya]